MSRFRVRRTPNSGPPTGLLFGELAYSDGDQQLYVGRADAAAPPTIFGEPPTDYGSEIEALETSQGTQDTTIAALSTEIATLATATGEQATALAALEISQAGQDSAIAANAAAVATLSSSQTAQDTAIAANAAAVATLNTSQGTQDTAIAANAAAVTTLNTSQASQDTAIAANATGVASLNTSQGTQDTAIAALQAKGFNFLQQGEPTVTPADAGKTWKEITAGGRWINNWEWSGSLWVAMAYTPIPLDYVTGASSFNSIVATSYRGANIPFKRALAVSLRVGILSSAPIDSTNRWDITAGFGRQQQGFFTTSLGGFSITSVTARTTQEVTLSGISNGTDENIFYVIATKVNSPALLTLGGAALIREIRA